MTRKNKIILSAATLLIVVFAAFFASSSPDGLEYVAEKLNFSGKAVSAKTLFTDYATPYINGPLSTIVSGVTGVLLCLLTGYLIGFSFKKFK